MSTCVYCKKPSEISPTYRLGNHNFCKDEMVDRVKNMICPRCGKKPIVDRINVTCTECTATSDFQGYNGPDQ